MAIEACPGGSLAEVLSGTLAQMRATTGSAAKPFYYNTDYKSVFYWAGDDWSPLPPNPRFGYYHYEEFDGATVAASFPFGNNTTGTGNAINGTPLGTIEGELVLDTPTAGQIANFRAVLNNTLIGGADRYMEIGFTIPTLATALEDYSFSFGYNDSVAYDANGRCTDGVYMMYHRGLNGTKPVLVTSAGGTRTETNSTVTDFVQGANRMKIYINGSTGVSYYLNGVLQNGTAQATNIPGAGQYTGYNPRLDKHAGSVSSPIRIDWVLNYGYFTSQRSA